MSKAFLLLSAAALGFIAHPVSAQSRGGDRVVVVGAAGIYRPEYKGSDDYEVQPFPYLSIRYPVYGMSLSLQGADLKLDVLPSDTFSFGPIIGFEQGRDDDIGNPAIRLLPTIDDAIEGGAFFEAELPFGPGSLSAGVKALTDLGDVHGGYAAAADVGYRLPLTDRISLGVGAQIKWADEDYMQTYYGVTASGAAASGLAAFDAESGIEKAGVNFNLAYRVTDRWGVALIGGYDRLMEAAADSPIVRREGSRDQYTSGLALFYRF